MESEMRESAEPILTRRLGFPTPIQLGLMLFVWMSLSACAKEGLVVEKGTNKPLAGAFVVAEWEGRVSLGFEGRSRCYATDVTQTNAEGRFRMGSFSWNFHPGIRERRQTILAFAIGYKVSAQDHDDTPIVLERLEGSNSEKFAAILGSPLGAYCEGYESDRSFLSFRKARARELQNLASTKEELRSVEGLLYGIDFLEFGENVAVEKLKLRSAQRGSNMGASKP
jgi:hypothetical protein